MNDVLSTNNKKILILIGVVLSVIYRSPELLIEPRFWAEEGFHYFKYAYESSFFDGLFMVIGEGAGYLLLLGNIAAVLATFVPLEYAPFVTTYFSLLIFLVPFVIILWGNSHLWDTSFKKLLAVLLVLFAPAISSPEVWLNTINSQVYCGIISLCILFEKEDISSKRLFFYCIVLFFAGLTGVYTTFLALPFFIKLLIERNKKSFYYFSIVVLVSCIQLSLFLLLKFSGEMATIKANYFDWSKAFIRIFYYHVITPLFGINLANLMLLNLTGLPTIEKFISSIATSSYLLLSVNFISFSLISATLIYLSKLSSSPYRWIFITAFICSSILITFGALHGIPENRYAVVPNAILGFFILSSIKKENILLNVSLIGSIIIGIFYFKYPTSNDIYLKYEPSQHAKWADEVHKWKQDDKYRLNIWPQGWSITLLSPRQSAQEKQEMDKFNDILVKQSALKVDLSSNDENMYTKILTIKAGSLPSNFILGMKLSLENFDLQYANQRLKVSLAFLGEKQKLCLFSNSILSLKDIAFLATRPLYLISHNYNNQISLQNVIQLPSFINNCSHKEIEAIQFTFTPINSAVPVSIEMSQFHSKLLGASNLNKKYSLFRFFK